MLKGYAPISNLDKDEREWGTYGNYSDYETQRSLIENLSQISNVI